MEPQMNEKLSELAIDCREAIREGDESRKTLLLEQLGKELPGLTDQELQEAALTIAAHTLSRS